MTQSTDKLLQKKYAEVASREGALSDDADFIEALLPNKRRNRKIWFVVAMAWFAVMIGGAIVQDEGRGIVMALVLAGTAAFYWLKARSQKLARFYELLDTYNELLTSRGYRSLEDIKRETHSSLEDIASEIKELQEVGFFRQFSVDRSHKLLVEDATWGVEGSGDYSKNHFVCKSCGASNDVYTRNGSSILKCEYCNTTTELS